MAADMDPEIDADMMSDDDIEASLFWSLKIPASGTAEITEPALPNYIVHITKACFGPKVVNGSRSVVMCAVDADDQGAPKYSPVCVLKTNTMENVDLDLIFGEAASFKIEGNKPCDVWLTGHLRPGYDTELDTPEDYLAANLASGEFEDLDEDNKLNEMSASLDDDGFEDDQVEQDSAPPQKKQKMNNGQSKATANNNNNNNNKNNKNKKKQKSPKNKPVTAPENSNNDNNKNKSQKKNKQSPTQKPAASPASQEPEQTQKQQGEKQQQKKKKYKKKNMTGGMQYKEVREGSGSAIKKGDKVYVYYIGQLASNQSIFDKTLSGEGFSFTVGKGEVIKGWELGLLGMKGVGSKRKLWIPATLAYGDEGQGTVPPNAKLVFTIEVKKVE